MAEMKTGKNKVEICLTPSVFPEFRNDDAIVVVVIYSGQLQPLSQPL